MLDDRALLDPPPTPTPATATAPTGDDRLAPRGRGGLREDRWAPPPPALGPSCPERLVRRQEEDSPRPRDGRSSSHGGGGTCRREALRGRGVDVPLPQPLGSFRPDRVVYRLEGDSPPAPTQTPQSRSEDGYKEKKRRSPSRRSPSPAPPKRPRRDEGGGLHKPPRGGRYEHGGGRGKFTGHHAPEVPESAKYGASSNGQDITQRKGLMTYKQFTQILEDDVSPAEAESRYQEYKASYITTQKRAYFDLHKDEIWLKQNYHPINLLSVIERRNAFCKAAGRNLILDLQNGTLDLGPGMTAGAANKSGSGSGESSENAEDHSKKRIKNGRGPPKETCPLSTVPEAHPISSKYRRILTDIDRTLALVQKLDAEKGIVGNILSTCEHCKLDVDKSHVGSMRPLVIVRGSTTVKGLEGAELLDTLLTYLWRVHGVDYYGMSEMRDAKGFRHVRAHNKSTSAFNISAADWEKKLDSFWLERLRNAEDPLVVLTAKGKIDAVTNETLGPYVKKIMDETYGWKYGCGAKGCAKVFHAPEFVHKHLKLKHPDLVSVLTSRVQDDIYCQNYMNDPNAQGGIPIMQRSTPVPAPDRMRRTRDEQILGAFDGQGSNAPFLPAFPPPLLIPVPGAGPLGPFIPAPPQMAIKMMLEQRPPRPNCVRRGNVGSTSSLPGPVVPMHLHFSRSLLRYNDHDTPVEGVAAIDYRSM